MPGRVMAVPGRVMAVPGHGISAACAAGGCELEYNDRNGERTIPAQVQTVTD